MSLEAGYMRERSSRGILWSISYRLPDVTILSILNFGERCQGSQEVCLSTWPR
jgi:hypothetical protein